MCPANVSDMVVGLTPVRRLEVISLRWSVFGGCTVLLLLLLLFLYWRIYIADFSFSKMWFFFLFMLILYSFLGLWIELLSFLFFGLLVMLFSLVVLPCIITFRLPARVFSPVLISFLCFVVVHVFFGHFLFDALNYIHPVINSLYSEWFSGWTSLFLFLCMTLTSVWWLVSYTALLIICVSFSQTIKKN